ncbi:MAG: hypothetical protein RR428_00660 [Coprobacillus sp.]
MKKIINQYLKRDMLIYLGIIVGVYYFVFNFAISTFTGTNMFLNIILVFGYLVAFAGSIILTVGSIYYYLKKSKDITVMILAIISVIVTVLSLFGIQFVSALISLGSGNYYSILANYNSWIAGLGIYGWAFYVAYLGGIYSIVLCLEMKKVIQIPKLNKLYNQDSGMISETVVNATQPLQTGAAQQVVQSGQPVQEAAQPIQQTAQPVQGATQPVQQPYVPPVSQQNQAPKKKTGLIIGAVVASLILLCGTGYFVYSTFFSSTSVDLVKSVDLELTGDNGKGYAKISATNDYEGEDSKVKSFLRTVYYTIDDSGEFKNGELENGQKVKVIAKYSEMSADKNNVKVINDEFEVEVKGLIERYTDGTKIPADLLKTMKADAEKKASANIYSSILTKYTIEFDSAYFADAGEYSKRLIMVFKSTTDLTSGTTKYIAYYISNPKSDYKSKDAYWFKMSLYDKDYKPVSKKEDIKAGLVKTFFINEGSLTELTIPE